VTSESLPDPTIVHACSGCGSVVGVEPALTAGHYCAGRTSHVFLALRLRMLIDVLRNLAEALERRRPPA